MSATVHVREPDPGTVLSYAVRADGHRSLVVMGPRTRASYLAPKSLALCVTQRLAPGRAQLLLGVPASELTDRIVELEALWGAAAGRLADELAELQPDERRIADRLADALTARLEACSTAELARADLVRHAAGRLSSGAARVPDVARSVGVSERHLRALFTSEVGVGPKRFGRIGRVRAVLGQVGTRDWAGLAAGAGYYDQSHMTAEFRAVMGVPPGAFRAGRLPSPTPCTG